MIAINKCIHNFNYQLKAFSSLSSLLTPNTQNITTHSTTVTVAPHRLFTLSTPSHTTKQNKTPSQTRDPKTFHFSSFFFFFLSRFALQVLFYLFARYSMASSLLPLLLLLLCVSVIQFASAFSSSCSSSSLCLPQPPSFRYNLQSQCPISIPSNPPLQVPRL